MIRRLAAACLAAPLALLLGLPAAAQTLSPEEARGAVAEVAKLIRERYVAPELKEPIAGKLEQALGVGRYAVSSPLDLADRVTEDLQAAGRDGHLGLSWDPAVHARLKAGNAEDGGGAELYAEEARRANHGLEEMAILDGNVRYLRIKSFYWQPDATGSAYDAAMRFLRDGEAVIIDLRGNNGGSTSAVRYAISHFMPGAPERLMMTFQGDDGAPDQSRVLGHLPAGRVTGKPLLVLVDGNAASAAEEFAYHVQQFRLGTLVGARTAGGANNNALFPVGTGFVASVSVYRPIHAVSGGNWEGTGVAPDVATEPGRALAAAHVQALETLAKRTGEARFAWALTAARAELNPPRPSPAELARYAGRYGERTVRAEGGALFYKREGRAEVAMRPLGGDLFALEGSRSSRIRFRMDGGRAMALEVLQEDGGSAAHPRTSR
ncbi:MAG TPA: S41 family peptidase [Azospirillaceae bacterium]|nr:S41 family peptidase [Azospirillaceae bacterium]